MVCTHIRVHRWWAEQGFWRCFTEGLNQSLVLSAEQAGLEVAQCLVEWVQCLELNQLDLG